MLPAGLIRRKKKTAAPRQGPPFPKLAWSRACVVPEGSPLPRFRDARTFASLHDQLLVSPRARKRMRSSFPASTPEDVPGFRRLEPDPPPRHLRRGTGDGSSHTGKPMRSEEVVTVPWNQCLVLLQPLPSSDAACHAWPQSSAYPASTCAPGSPREASSHQGPSPASLRRARPSRSCRLPSCRSHAHPLRRTPKIRLGSRAVAAAHPPVHAAR